MSELTHARNVAILLAASILPSIGCSGDSIAQEDDATDVARPVAAAIRNVNNAFGAATGMPAPVSPAVTELAVGMDTWSLHEDRLMEKLPALRLSAEELLRAVETAELQLTEREAPKSVAEQPRP